jgi:hypothetical protein
MAKNPQAVQGFVMDKSPDLCHYVIRRGVVPCVCIVKTKVFLPVHQAHAGNICLALSKTFDSPAAVGMLDRSAGYLSRFLLVCLHRRLAILINTTRKNVQHGIIFRPLVVGAAGYRLD